MRSLLPTTTCLSPVVISNGSHSQRPLGLASRTLGRDHSSAKEKQDRLLRLYGSYASPSSKPVGARSIIVTKTLSMSIIEKWLNGHLFSRPSCFRNALTNQSTIQNFLCFHIRKIETSKHCSSSPVASRSTRRSAKRSVMVQLL